MPIAEDWPIDRDASNELLTIRELVEAGGLNLSLAGGAQGKDRRVEAVYIGDLADPTPWMVPGSLLLTTGPTLETDPEAGPRLVRLLKENDMVGVGVAIMPHVHHIPKAMTDAADAIGLPVLRVPPETPFRDVTSYVFNALTSRDMHRLRRSLALQNQLLQVLLAEQGVEGLVRRLAEFIEGDTVLFDSHGNVLASSSLGQPSADATLPAKVWEEYRNVSAKGSPRSVLEVGSWRARFREAHVEDAVERVLVVIQPLSAVISEFEEATLTFAQRLVEVELNTTRNVAGVRRRTRSGLLEMLVRGRGTAMELGERLLYHGILPAQSWRILVIDVAPSRRPAGASTAEPAYLDGVLDAVDGMLEELQMPFLSLPLEGRIVVLAPLPDEGDAAGHRAMLVDAVARLGARLNGACVRVGASEPLRAADAAPSGLAHARQAVDRALQGGVRCADVVLYEDLGLGAMALDQLPDALLEVFRDKVVGRLETVDEREGADLLHSLQRYLAHDCSVAKAAEELYLHRNTLRKRLARIEKVVGLDLSSTDDVVEAYLSVRAAELLKIRER